MHSGNLNNTRFDDLRKPMKKTSFVVKKNLGGVGGGGGNYPKRTIHYIKLRYIVQEEILPFYP